VDYDFQVKLMGRKDFFWPELVEKLGFDAYGMDYAVPLPGHITEGGVEIRTRDTTKGLVTCEADLEKLQFPDPSDFFEQAKNFLSQKKDFATFAKIRTGVSATYLIMGWEAFSYALMDNIDLVKKVLKAFSEWTLQSLEYLNKLDFDFYFSADDLGYKSGLLFSPNLFRSLFLPVMREVTAHYEKPWVFHSDGDFSQVLEDLLTLGMSGLNPIEPGAMDIVSIKKEFGHRVCLVGNIDLHYTLTRGTPKEVKQEVKERIKQLAPGGGYILSSSNSITSYCKMENVLAMRDALFRFGQYPIDIL
jgi:uroporphyrinogen decarboxylase